MSNDVFDHLHELGTTPVSVVVGSGPHVLDVESQIPDAWYSIAINGAIWAHPRANLWATWGLKARTEPWFQDPHCVPQKLLMGYLLAEAQKRYTPDYIFYHGKGIYGGGLDEPRKLAGGATIAGCMILLLHHAGVRCVALAGVDMRGPRHFDGSPTGESERPWGQMQSFGILLRWVAARGTRVVTLSESALEQFIPRVSIDELWEPTAEEELNG